MELHRACDLACEESSAGHSAKVLFSTRHLTGDATGLHLEVVDRSLDSLIQVQGVLIEMMPRRVLILNNMLKHPAVHALDQGVGRRNGLERVVRDILRRPCDRRQACAFATHALVEPESLRRRRIVPFPIHLIHQPFQAHRILPKAHGGIPSSTATPLHNTSERSLPTPDAAAPPVKLHSPPLCGQVGKSMRELQCARVGVCQRQRSTTGAQLAHVLM